MSYGILFTFMNVSNSGDINVLFFWYDANSVFKGVLITICWGVLSFISETDPDWVRDDDSVLVSIDASGFTIFPSLNLHIFSSFVIAK